MIVKSTHALGALVLGSLALGVSAFAARAAEVNVYTYRELALIKPLLDAFTAETGVKVNTIFAQSGLEERIQAEGASSPADILLTTDIGRLAKAVDMGIAQPIKSATLEKAVPATLRDPNGQWFALSMRARVIYASKERVKDATISYENLADPKWKGKICIRDGQHIYNNGLFAAYVAHHGEAATQAWLTGVKANLAHKPSGGDRETARDIASGQCDLGIGNTYYVGLMLNKSPEQKPWGEAIRVILPSFEKGGTHVNVSGFLIARNAPNKDAAVKLGEWLAGPKAQALFAAQNYEWPVSAGVAVDPQVAAWGAIKPDTIPLSDVAKYRKTASELVDKVGFNAGPGN